MATPAEKLITLRGGGQTLTLRVVPRISESRTATLTSDPIPGKFPVVVYNATGARTFSFSGSFVSRTKQEADENHKNILLIKSWVLPEDGRTETPQRLVLKGWKNLFHKVQVTLQTYSIQYPDDTDYVEGSEAYMPIVLPFSFTLMEDPDEGHMQKFTLEDYRAGSLEGF